MLYLGNGYAKMRFIIGSQEEKDCSICLELYYAIKKKKELTHSLRSGIITLFDSSHFVKMRFYLTCRILLEAFRISFSVLEIERQ